MAFAEIEDFDFYKLANKNVTHKDLLAVTIHNLLRKLLSLDEIFFSRNVSKWSIKNLRYGGWSYICCNCKRKSVPRLNAVVKARDSCAIQSVITVQVVTINKII